MKRPLFSVFILASLMVAIAHCFPNPARSDSDGNDRDGIDTVLVLPERNPFSLPRPFFRMPEFQIFEDDSDDETVEDPFGMGISPWGQSSFNGFLDNLQGLMNRIQAQMSGVLSGLPRPGSFGFGARIPEGGNTTSTTKIINGHVVTINETTYQSSDNDSNIVLRVNIVDVKPVNSTVDGIEEVEVDLDDSDDIETVTTRGNDSTNDNKTTNGKKETTEETTQPARSVETVEDSVGNEIPMKEEIDNLNA